MQYLSSFCFTLAKGPRTMDNAIKAIDPDSPLAGKVRPGDTLLAINSNKILDVLDYKFFAYDTRLELRLRRPEGSEYSLHVVKPEGGDLGLDFESYLMDKPRSCANRCVFCFIDQLPGGMRPTMYFKDDDARLSFLLGNYITLTNLSKREIERIIALHISPINISVHATDPELRRRLLRSPRAGECMDIMGRFAEAGITMNCQIVCCPGLNDGEALMQSMRDLEALYPQVHSVSVVPVGLTKFREGLYPLSPFTKELAAETLDMVDAFGGECLRRHGSRIFWCGDELYIKAGREIPPDEFYEDYTQLENGVGMLRLMETEFSSALKLGGEPDGRPFSIATGVSAAPYFQILLDKAKEKYPEIKGRIYPIVNDFFGHSINVTGLITGGDLIAQLKDRELGERLLISQNMLRRAKMDFLDDVKLEEASAALGLPVYPIEQDGFALFDAMCGQLPELRLPVREEDGEQFYRYNQN